jgi:hypothetical protein
MNDQEQDNLWQELKCLWQEQKTGTLALTADEQIALIRKKMARLHQKLNTTDSLGLAASAVIIVVFTFYFFTSPNLVMRIGDLILIGGALFASWKTIRCRRSTPQPIADAPVIEWLKYDLVKVHQQAELSRTVMWWYLLPILIGMNVFFWAQPVSFSIKIGPSVLTVLIAAVTYWLNQRVRRKQWLPLQKELEAMEDFLHQESQTSKSAK